MGAKNSKESEDAFGAIIMSAISLIIVSAILFLVVLNFTRIGVINDRLDELEE